MIIDFSQLEEITIEQFYGGQLATAARMFSDGVNRIMSGRLVPGASIGLHRHEGSSEIMFIVSGSGRAVCDEAEELLSPGLCHYCPAGCQHSVVNDGSADLVFLTVVPQHGGV